MVEFCFNRQCILKNLNTKVYLVVDYKIWNSKDSYDNKTSKDNFCVKSNSIFRLGNQNARIQCLIKEMLGEIEDKSSSPPQVSPINTAHNLPMVVKLTLMRNRYLQHLYKRVK
ncbi:hypothetical protein RF11_11698 [Thelohanellus kitauei]|uniref:Uncharacterized protein n=1 Tax=Thelohanellus kitauei TaxID=669202 RepID=A0A0C2IAT5_THEKT|nr:hypothetical protein RF11_11698 [Thelohanellus kitauei]